ncbi:hypothetical protein CFP65_7610 [Kitasatospora sp. MMS16-BH015]|uniref:hypothetical protein n=1 Tax=Kitasatospora sp. MMS16-BH015 TaxID=2018025 RepID=UPI000CA1A6EE|nr:hypothetical protein [Kitasatospora sp. MMS16-BH015]AUG82181.1 hypothetical protein CFP65_7610 [Kitasatospora sp. MMS16-BH015]
MRTTARYEVDTLFRGLIDQFSRARLPMPVVVLHAAEADPALDAEVAAVVTAVQEAQESGGLPYRLVVPPEDGDPHRNAIAALEAIARGPWARRGPAWYRGYPTPRSRLVAAIEAAAHHVLAAEPAGLPPEDRVEAVLVRLRELHWRPARRTPGLQQALSPLFNSTTLIGAFVLAGLTTLLTQAHWEVVLSVVLGSFLVLLLTGWVRRNTAPLSWLGQASRWFATTTFLAASGRQAAAWSLWRPRMSWDVTQARAREVAGEIIKAQLDTTPAEERDRAQQFHLQLRTLALLEDLRVAHRAWAPDLRGRKRRVPPVVFLPRAGAANGGLRVLGAISDVRSRRSEQDPLLVVAGIGHADVALWLEAGGPGPAEDGRRGGPYENWVSNLRVRQAPSGGRALAWTLPVRLSRAELGAEATTSLAPVPVRRTAWVLWSRWAVLAVLVLAACGGLLRNQQLAGEYCAGRLLGSNHDTVWRPDPAGRPECIGVATGGVGFARPSGVRLSGALPGQGDPKAPGAQTGLAELESAIRQENDRVLALPDVRYVTVVYAGSLTASDGQETRALNSLKELAGVYLAQLSTNVSDPLKLRVLVANAGQDMRHQIDMVRRIVALAAHDRSIAGVVGLGRDTTHSEEAVALLQQAGLAVVDTSNSATDLARRHLNYFGLSATDEEEAHALAEVLTGLGLTGPGTSAAVLTRPSGRDDDQYSQEQAKYGRQLLVDGKLTLVADQPLVYDLTANGDPVFGDALRAACRPTPPARPASVLYLAGRSDDLDQLMHQLANDPACAGVHTVLTGDDLTKARFHRADAYLAPGTTVYYVALTDPAATAGPSGLAGTAAADLGLQVAGPDPYQDDLFSDGAISLGHDAALALHVGAGRAGASQLGGIAAVMAGLRAVSLANAATGTVDFTRYPPLADQPGHGITLLRARQSAGKPIEVTRVCGRPAGTTDDLTDCRP